MVQHAHHVHPLTPLITYSNEHFSPGTPPSHLSPEILDPKTGKTYFTLFYLTCTANPQACLGFTCRYSPHTSPFGALALLPPVSWSCGLHCPPPGLVHATVSLSSLMRSQLVAVVTLDWYLFFGLRMIHCQKNNCHWWLYSPSLLMSFNLHILYCNAYLNE